MKAVTKTFTLLTLIIAVMLSAGMAQAKTLDAGTFYLEPKVGFYGSFNDRISSMFTYGGEAGYFVADGLSMGVEGLGYVITQKRSPWMFSGKNDETVHAFSPIMMLRYHFVNLEQFSAFGGFGVGGFFAQTRVPYNGYSSSLTEALEVGMNVFLSNNVSLQLAGRWQHIGEFSEKGSNNLGGNFAVKYAF